MKRHSVLKSCLHSARCTQAPGYWE